MPSKKQLSSAPLIMIPGLLCDERLWEPIIPQLSDVAACTVTGQHTRFNNIGRIADAISDEAPPRFSLAGLSMGGYIALEICRRFPERVERLALLDTSARPDTPEQTQRRQTMTALCQKGKFAHIAPLLYTQMVHAERLTDDLLRSRIAAMAERLGPEVFIRQQQAIIDRIDQRPHLTRIPCPTVVICGRQDGLTPLDRAEEMARSIPNARLEVIEACGHMSTMERPEVVGGILRQWIAPG